MARARATGYVALLRAVNVGAGGRVPMTALRQVFCDLGYEEVSTYVQSGNVVFASSEDVDRSSVEAAVEEKLGLVTAVALRRSAEMERIVDANPFAGRDVSKVHVAYLTGGPADSGAAGADALSEAAQRFAPEELVVREGEVYMYLPGGIGRSKLAAHVARRLGGSATVRNWRSTERLASMATEAAAAVGAGGAR